LNPFKKDEIALEDVSQALVIEVVSKQTQDQAKNIILSGLQERFGYLDDSYNKDLDDIYHHYMNGANIFLIGRLHNKVICTAALIHEKIHIGRVVRMSVLQEHRRRGYARRMLEEIEMHAHSRGFEKIVLETTNNWYDAISFYESHGYVEYDRNEDEVHLMKELM
jgi:ribosomal protein S18 acetylase RimI-like enzyme